MHKITVLLVSSPALSQVIEHLFREYPDFEVVGNVSGFKSLGQHTRRVLPELIVANIKPVSTGVCQAVVAIKQASPASKLILVCPVLDFARAARKCGADAFLNDEQLVGHLVPMACALSDCQERPGYSH